MILDAPKIPNEFKRVIVTNTVNIQETNERSVTEVLPKIGLRIENASRQLKALRAKHGAETKVGHRCSNLVEMLKNYRTAKGERKAGLARNMQRTMNELAALTAMQGAQIR